MSRPTESSKTIRGEKSLTLPGLHLSKPTKMQTTQSMRLQVALHGSLVLIVLKQLLITTSRPWLMPRRSLNEPQHHCQKYRRCRSYQTHKLWTS